MSTHTLKPWTDLVKLHPDVESDTLTEAMFAIDLGGVAANDPNMPAVYRQAEAFFRATYLTTDLRKLLEEILACLAGGSHAAGFNRVLKLRTHFGGGKSHTLAALLHAAKTRSALNVVPEAAGFADPGKVDVAVFDGEKFDARVGRDVGNGVTIKTMWGWIAWQLGQNKYKLVEQHDRDMVSPGGDVVKAILEGGPKLILLDEVLKYMERASAVQVNESTLQRQSMDFLQNLTVEVAGSTQAAMVYSLQWSAREALGNVALLQQIDKLTSRVDQMREPVAGDEILLVLQKRLLGGKPAAATAQAVATAYGDVVTNMWRAHAETPSAKKDAEERGVDFQKRVEAAYPFHPAFIDVMKDRWASVDGFQRTRGALRFLAQCLHSLKKHGNARAILGPAEVPVNDAEVCRSLLKDLDPKGDYYPVISSDIVGPNAKAKKIDDRLAKENPSLASVRPALRLATAILVYSFGGLRRDGVEDGETLPPGVSESELLAAAVGPELDSITAGAVLAELKTSCLYLHYDGVRYCFKKDPNVVAMIEDAEQEVARDAASVRDRVKQMLTTRLQGRSDAVLWPEKASEIPDKEPQFLIGYLPQEFATKNANDQEAAAKDLLFNCGDTHRRYRNGVAIAVPDKRQLEPLRRAVRYLLAIERVEVRKTQLRLSKDQLQQLKERRQTEEAAAEGAIRNLYAEVWLPKMEAGAPALEKVDRRGRTLQATTVHEQMTELLTSLGRKWVHTSVTPQKIVERVKLGEDVGNGQGPRLGVPTADVLEGFFCFLDPPRIDKASALQKAIAKGVADGVFGYTSGSVPSLGLDGKFLVAPEKVVIGRLLDDDEVDLESGFIMTPQTVPTPAAGAVSTGAGGTGPVQPVQPDEQQTPTQPQPGARATRTAIRIRFTGSREQVFKSFQAIANLADKSDGGKISLQVEGSAAQGYDPAWLRNAVEEPLDEAGADALTID